MKKILLDTNAYGQFMAGNVRVFEIIGESDAVYVSIFVFADSSNDIWIAAHAMETGSVLVTNDVHFDQVPGIRTLSF